MENLPFYISGLFIATTLLTLFFLYKSSNRSLLVTGIAVAWLSLQAGLGLSGFYTITTGIPPRFMLLIGPPLVCTVILFSSSRRRAFVDSWNARWLTYLHIVRVPVEIVLFLLFIHHQVPQIMTFEGHNYDILSGVTAPVVAYLAFTRKQLSRTILLAWNFICVALLLNIVVTAVLSIPLPFQQFAFEQPNRALLYFPFIWLPCFIVPVVLLSHLVMIRRLCTGRPL
jgi:hypothetical protein